MATVSTMEIRCPLCGSFLLTDGDKTWCNFVDDDGKACGYTLSYEEFFLAMRIVFAESQKRKAAQLNL